MDNENQPDIDGLETEGALALQRGARREGVPGFMRKRTGERALRVVGEPTEEELERRLAQLEDLGDPADFAKPGSVSYQLMEQIWTLDEEAAREKLEEILTKVAGPRHLRPIIPALVAALENRKLDGMTWRDITDSLRLEVPLEGYAITVADMNGYTSCLLKGKFHEKVEVATAVIRMFNEVAKVTGADLLEPVEGDAGMFLTYSAEQQARLEDELQKRKISMRIKKLMEEKHADGTEKYPMDLELGTRIFTESIGVHVLEEEKNPEDALKMVLYSGKGKNRGALVVNGKARDAAVKYQKDAAPGALLKKEGVVGKDTGKPSWGQDIKLPSSMLISVKLIEALLKLSPYSTAAFKQLLTGEGSHEVRTAKMNAYYMALDLNPAATEDAQKVDRFWQLLTDNGTGDDRIEMFKPAGSRGAHFWTQGIKGPKEFKAAFGNLNKRINQMAQECGLSFRLSLGYEQALEYIPIPDSFQVDATGPSIVATVRGLAGLEASEEGNWISVDRSAVTAMGLVGVEMQTIYVKGTPYQVVQVRLGPDGEWEVRESLVGREEDEKAIDTFVDSLGSNGVAFRIHKPVGATETGYGESALVRAGARHAKSQGIKTIKLKSEENLFTELEAHLGYSVDELMQNPQRLDHKLLLTLDEDSFAPDLAARLDQFLFAMAGTKLGLLYTGAYQFRPEALMGDAYKCDELRMDREIGELTPKAALDIVFQARPDLKVEDKPLIEQLLREWGRALVPRPLIHNFAPALYKKGEGTWDFSHDLSSQARAGELDHSLEEAGLTEHERTVLGVIAEVGYPIPLGFIQNILRFDCSAALARLAESYKSRTEEDMPPFICVSEEGFSLRDPSLRQARLLARKHQPAIQALLQEFNMLGGEPVVSAETVDRSVLELEHAFANGDSCKSPRTLTLLSRVGSFYLREKKNFGAAYGLYCRFLEASEAHEVDLSGLPEDLLHDLMWVLLETSHKKDTEHAQALLKAHAGVSTPELMWRGRMRLLHLLSAKDEAIESPPPEDRYAKVLDEMTIAFDKMDAVGIKLHPKLIKDLKLVHSFTSTAKVSGDTYPSEEVLPLAFSGAALSRLACASRQLARLAKIARRKLPDEAGLVTALDAAADDSKLDTLSRLRRLEANLVFLETKTPLDQELRAEILRCLLDAYKYLAPSPNDEELGQIQRYHGHTEKSFSKLSRPVQSAALDAFEVQSNAVALHWQTKLPLPNVFSGETEDGASTEDKAAIWKTLTAHEEKVRVQLGSAVRHALLPYRLRLTHQLMNFLQLKMRLIARTFKLEDKPLFDELHAEYISLAEDSGRVCVLLTGEAQEDYYGLECLPIKKAVDAMATA